MVAVDSEGKVVNVGYTFVKEGITFRVVSITPPANGVEGSIQILDTITNAQYKAYPTKFGGKWSAVSSYNNQPKYAKKLTQK